MKTKEEFIEQFSSQKWKPIEVRGIITGVGITWPPCIGLGATKGGVFGEYSQQLMGTMIEHLETDEMYAQEEPEIQAITEMICEAVNMVYVSNILIDQVRLVTRAVIMELKDLQTKIWHAGSSATIQDKITELEKMLD